MAWSFENMSDGRGQSTTFELAMTIYLSIYSNSSNSLLLFACSLARTFVHLFVYINMRLSLFFHSKQHFARAHSHTHWQAERFLLLTLIRLLCFSPLFVYTHWTKCWCLFFSLKLLPLFHLFTLHPYDKYAHILTQAPHFRCSLNTWIT